MKRILIIQTAFIGDVILATPLVEKLHEAYPEYIIDFLLRKGNEGLFANHPYINKIYIWNKKEDKYRDLFNILMKVRQIRYDYIINLQRFLSTGIFTILSGSKIKIGFKKNPLSLFFSQSYSHIINKNNKKLHEVDRNLILLTRMVNIDKRILPRLYPSKEDYSNVYEQNEYITISPTSVWYTKQYPAVKWIEVINLIPANFKIFILGGTSDIIACNWIKTQSKHQNISVMAGKLNLLESAALMKNARMNFVNDSAPLHLASSVDAPVTAIFCSTVPSFGFGPLSDISRVIETSENLKCRPCGLHGYKKCPEIHFRCADIPADVIVNNVL